MKRSNFRHILLILMLLNIFSLSVLSEGVQEEPGEDIERTIRIAGLKGPTSIGMLPLFDNPPMLDRGIKTEFVIVPEPQLMIARIMSGEVDIAAVPINLAAVLHNKGIPYGFGAVAGDGLLHVVTSRNDISTIEDLRGKRVYCIGQGSTPEFILRYTLAQNGLDPDKDLTLDFSFDHTAITPQLVSGKVDIAVLPEPFVSITAAKNSSVRPVIDLQKVWAETSGTGDTYPITAILVKDELYSDYAKNVDRFFELYADAIDWVKENPGATGELAAEYMDMPAKIIADAIPRLNLRFQLPREARSRVDELYEVLHSFAPASVGGKVPGNDFYAH